MIVRGGTLGTFEGVSYTGLTGRVVAGYNGGAWDGPGIATAMPAALDGLTTLAIASTADLGDPATFAGEDVSGGNAIVIAYTYAGDTNFDGQISGDDYGTIDFSILVPGASGYYNGDFNYDGVINGDDYGVIDFTIIAQGAAFPMSDASASSIDVAMLASPAPPAGVSAVPEPASLAVVAGALSCTLLRRRRRSRSSRTRR
jgi:hypothetical protein